MYCSQCSTSFDSTKLYVHLRQHKDSAQDLDLKCIFVLMDSNNIQRLFRAKMESTMEQLVNELRQFGVARQCLPRLVPQMETFHDDLGIGFMFTYGWYDEIKILIISSLKIFQILNYRT